MEFKKTEELEELDIDIKSKWVKSVIVVVSLLAITLIFYTLYIRRAL